MAAFQSLRHKVPKLAPLSARDPSFVTRLTTLESRPTAALRLLQRKAEVGSYDPGPHRQPSSIDTFLAVDLEFALGTAR